MNSLLLIFSSIFLNKWEYENLLKNYIQKLLDPEDTIYILLMISINKVDDLESKNLLKNWPTTFTMVIHSILNVGGVERIEQKQTLEYFDKLGVALFNRNWWRKERLFGLFLIFAAKQQELFQFLCENYKNSWRVDLSVNLLCTIDSFLNEKDADSYEVTMLKLAFYRADIIFKNWKENYQYCLGLIEGILKRKKYLINLGAENTIKNTEELKQNILLVYKEEKEEIHKNLNLEKHPEKAQHQKEEMKEWSNDGSLITGLFTGFKSYFSNQEGNERENLKTEDTNLNQNNFDEASYQQEDPKFQALERSTDENNLNIQKPTPVSKRVRPIPIPARTQQLRNKPNVPPQRTNIVHPRPNRILSIPNPAKSQKYDLIIQ